MLGMSQESRYGKQNKQNAAKRGRWINNTTIFLITVGIVFALAHFLHLFDVFAKLTQRYEAFELEILAALLILISALTVFSLRRVSELRVENERRIHAEEELRKRNEELEAFSHTVSHDLQSSLAVISAFSEVARQALSDKDVDLEIESLDQMARAAKRMSGMIESLLMYARAGHPEGEMTRVDPAEIVREVLLEYEREMSRKGMKAITMEEFPAVIVDPYKLRQVLSNLIGNAVKYGGDAPEPLVETGAVKEGGQVIFHVHDNGAGISYHDQEAIFNPFIRSDAGGLPGQGLGLSIVKRAVEAWEGQVWLESVPGEGSSFFFSVAAADPDS